MTLKQYLDISKTSLYSFSFCIVYQLCNHDPIYRKNFNDNTSGETKVTAIVPVTIVWTLIIVCCCCYCVRRYRRKRRYNQNIRTRGVSLTSTYRDAIGENEIHMPYTLASSDAIEESPPSYESVVSSFPTRY